MTIRNSYDKKEEGIRLLEFIEYVNVENRLLLSLGKIPRNYLSPLMPHLYEQAHDICEHVTHEIYSK